MAGESFAPATAAAQAPHFSCAITTHSGAPRCCAAYSMLASDSGSQTLPATRITNSSPSPALKTCSGGTRLSAQVTTMANGL